MNSFYYKLNYSFIMKTRFFIAAAAAFALVSCNSAKIEGPEPGAGNGYVEGTEIEISVGIDGAATKATSVTEAGEKTVNTLQVFVFRTDNNMSLDACGMASTNSVNVKCTSGSRKIYALVNAPDITDEVFSESDLLNTATLLSDNASPTSLVMIGNMTKTLTVPGEAVSVEVKRVASSIVLNKVSVNWASPAQAAGEFKITGMYLLNVNGKNNYAISEETAETAYWYNRLTKTENAFPVAGMTADLTLSEEVTSSKSYDKAHTFYAYPNSESYVSNGTWSARSTLIVVEASFKGLTDASAQTYYYPIAVENIESNKKYIIPELVITRLGSKNPWEVVTFSECSFSVTVKDWDKPVMSTETI